MATFDNFPNILHLSFTRRLSFLFWGFIPASLLLSSSKLLLSGWYAIDISASDGSSSVEHLRPYLLFIRSKSKFGSEVKDDIALTLQDRER